MYGVVSDPNTAGCEEHGELVGVEVGEAYHKGRVVPPKGLRVAVSGTHSERVVYPVNAVTAPLVSALVIMLVAAWGWDWCNKDDDDDDEWF